MNNFTRKEVIHEMARRKRKETSVIIFNLPETRENDVQVIVKLTKFLQVKDEIQAEKTIFYRLGKKVKGGCRPLRLVLGSVEDVKLILRSAKNLKYFSECPNISIAKDMTPWQLRRKREILREFRIRKAEGEDVDLRYNFGMPVIVGGDGTLGRKKDFL